MSASLTVLLFSPCVGKVLNCTDVTEVCENSFTQVTKSDKLQLKTKTSGQLTHTKGDHDVSHGV